MSISVWVALGLLAIASVLPKSYAYRLLLGGFGWASLSIYWFLQPHAYIEIEDYFNSFLVVVAAIVSLFIAYTTFQAKNKKDRDILISLSRAASVGGLIYFLFAEVDFLNIGIISLVTSQSIWVVEKIGFPVAKIAWNQLAVNGQAVEIILACTAIESIALFLGLISSAKGAQHSRKVKAFMISVPVIYILNLMRVSFTASAYGFAWFGTPEESFHISEHVITKAGSILALLLISYMVLRLLPEVSDMIEGIVKMMKNEFQRLTTLT